MGVLGKESIGVLDSQNKPSNSRELFIYSSNATSMLHVQLLMDLKCGWCNGRTDCLEF